MPMLPALGVISYNGYTFGPMTSSEITGKPIYDQAGRTIVYVVYTITIKSIISLDAVGANAPAIDGTLEDIRRKLQSAGGQFKYTGKGFGDFQINVQDVKDVVWGPKPNMLRWKPLGADRAAEITWQVEVAIPECTAAKYQFALMEVNYKWTIDIDKSGYTKRTIAGFLRIPQTRATQATRTLSDSADAYREQIEPDLPIGYRRTHNFTMDESKCRLDFSIIDEEMAAPLQESTVDCQATFNVNSDRSNMAMATCTLSATYEMVKWVSKSRALRHFDALAKSRIEFARKTIKGSVIGPAHFAISEDVFGKKAAAFTMAWVIVGELNSVFQSAGLWLPVPGADFALWRASLEKSVMSPRGLAGLRFPLQSDALIDLCKQPTVLLRTQPLKPLDNRREAFALRSDIPKPDSSWLRYRSWLSIKERSHTVELKPLPITQVSLRTALPGEIKLPSDLASGGGGAKLLNNTDGYKSPFKPQASIVQHRATPSVYITLEGQAVRAGYAIQPPALLSVGGIEAVPANGPRNGFKQAIVANWGGLPIVAAKWSQRYLLPEMPGAGVGVPPNNVLAG